MILGRNAIDALELQLIQRNSDYEKMSVLDNKKFGLTTSCASLYREYPKWAVDKWISTKLAEPVCKMSIKLISDSPIRQLSYFERDKVSKTIEELLHDNIIRPSNLPFASQLYLLK